MFEKELFLNIKIMSVIHSNACFMRLNAENKDKLGNFSQCRSLETKGTFRMA